MGAKGGAGEPRIVGLSILIMRVYAWGSPVIGSERGISLESINNSMHSMMAMGLRRCGKLTYYLRQYKRLAALTKSSYHIINVSQARKYAQRNSTGKRATGQRGYGTPYIRYYWSWIWDTIDAL
jgi:hypothetical protein